MKVDEGLAAWTSGLCISIARTFFSWVPHSALDSSLTCLPALMLPTPAKLSGPKLLVQRHGAAQLVGAAITKHHRPGGLDNRNVFSSQSWGWKSKAQALAGLASPGASCWGSQRLDFSLALHMVFSLCLCLDRFFLERHQSYWIQASHLGPHFTLIQSLEAQIHSHSETLGVSTWPWMSAPQHRANHWIMEVHPEERWRGGSGGHPDFVRTSFFPKCT